MCREKRGNKMDLRTLRYFTVVAEELNITHAAERLCMSQPPLSNQMKALEEELGTKLFIRGKRQLQLTDAGRLLLLRATQILDMTEKAQHEVMSLEGGMSGTINLGIVEGRAPFLTARWIAGFKEEFPNVKYSMWNGSSDDVLDRLRQGLVDLAVIAAPYDTEHLEGITVGRGHVGRDNVTLKRACRSRRRYHTAQKSCREAADRPQPSLAHRLDTRMVCRGERRAEYYMHAVKLS